ncbi:hypothetical protein D0T25_12270 [Duganella sp. BJB488]|uniref:hypothetical protein n=1 Tax=unclassified Duganella TaxID=2636909 RepID=UPI000E352900|nr:MULTISPECIES: hypothetical protein [unclassified Duganella]RFP17534.1 hypothetical protein D0T26_15010 [Duganella sp. BJB489]RFP22045.1 hypothetical protein D0T25_12270 [Duganella sp. BJB488]RFP37378.1 hypothetical protein D0T24_05110 [Duganella sp. BJB480]
MTDHVFEVTWNGSSTPDWTFDGQKKPEQIKVKPGEKIHFKFFQGLAVGDRLYQAVLLSGNETGAEDASPFGRPFPLVLESDNLLTVGKKHGTWGFCIVFSINEEVDKTRFFFVPDPELQVGSRP